MCVAKKMFGSACHPADGTAETPRRFHQQRIFPVKQRLGAKAAPYILCNDVDVLGIDVKNILGNQILERMDALTCRAESEGRVRHIISCNRRPRLDIIRDDAVIDYGHPHDIGGDRKGLIRSFGVAKEIIVSDVTRRSIEDRGRSGLYRFGKTDDAFEDLPVYIDCVDGASCLLRCVRDHHRHHVADVENFALSDYRIGLQRGQRAVRIVDAPQAFDRPQRFKIRCGIDRTNARQTPDHIEVGKSEARVSMGTAQEGGSERAVGNDIGGERTAARQQANILDAFGWLAYPQSHSRNPFKSAMSFRLRIVDMVQARIAWCRQILFFSGKNAK